MKVLIAYTVDISTVFQRPKMVIQRKIIELKKLPTNEKGIEELERRELKYLSAASIFSFSVLEP